MGIILLGLVILVQLLLKLLMMELLFQLGLDGMNLWLLFYPNYK